MGVPATPTRSVDNRDVLWAAVELGVSFRSPSAERHDAQHQVERMGVETPWMARLYIKEVL